MNHLVSRFTWKLIVTGLSLVMTVSVAAKSAVIPAPPSLAAQAYVLMDADSGYIIAAKDENGRLPPASLTKLMTSYVLSHELASGRVTDQDMVTISENAWTQNPVFRGSSFMSIEVGKQVNLADLHRGIVISSGNDASVAVAEYLAGSEAGFADVMNQHAKRLGMENSYFENSHGLHAEGHYTSALDLAILSRALIKEYPRDYALYSEKSFTYNNITQSNRNRLLWRDPSFDGLKTGYTEKAGYCLIASATRNGQRLISVVLGADSKNARERETQKLTAYGFRFFETHKQFVTGDKITTPVVWSGAVDSVDLTVETDGYITIPRGRHGDVSATIKLDSMIKAPVLRGHEYGELVVTLDDEELLRTPLVAAEDVDSGPWFKRAWHSIVLFFKQFFG